MRIYIPGPASEDQKATAQLLIERDYRVFTSAMVASPKYYLNGKESPNTTQLRNSQANEMLLADAVVLTDELDQAYAAEVVTVCRFLGIPVVRYDALPVCAPGCGAVQNVLDCIDLGNPLEEPTMTWTAMRERVMRFLDSADRAFSVRFGWFFMNGNKMPKPAEYKLNTKILTTA